MAWQKLLNKYIGREGFLTPSGDAAIEMALKHLSGQGYTSCLIPDQGGWLSYRKLPEKYGLKLIEVPTDYGLIDPNQLKRLLTEKSMLLLNSIAGYAAPQPMREITEACRKAKTLLINDVSGSIGTPAALYGDLILGSFGRWKPVDLGKGGFIAGIDTKSVELPGLEEKLMKLKERLAFLHDLCKQVKEDLAGMEIIHREKQGLVVIVAYDDDAEKRKIIEYCKGKEYDHTECPRYIRVMRQAISIEVKRK
ncbi:MAG: hypothetical protein KJ709_04610 [Nanoarchaeota archaeon]|nr:hypothetical protein [Nanoarchaeota archaeon]